MTHERIQNVIITPSTWGRRSSESMVLDYSMFRDVNVGFVLDVKQQTRGKDQMLKVRESRRPCEGTTPDQKKMKEESEAESTPKCQTRGRRSNTYIERTQGPFEVRTIWARHVSAERAQGAIVKYPDHPRKKAQIDRRQSRVSNRSR
jgi:hypothetical protein